MRRLFCSAGEKKTTLTIQNVTTSRVVAHPTGYVVLDVAYRNERVTNRKGLTQLELLVGATVAAEGCDEHVGVLPSATLALLAALLFSTSFRT